MHEKLSVVSTRSGAILGPNSGERGTVWRTTASSGITSSYDNLKGQSIIWMLLVFISRKKLAAVYSERIERIQSRHLEGIGDDLCPGQNFLEGRSGNLRYQGSFVQSFDRIITRPLMIFSLHFLLDWTEDVDV